MELHTPKRNSQGSAATQAAVVGAEGPMANPAIGDTRIYPWTWGDEARKAKLSPGSSCSSPEYNDGGGGGGPDSGNDHVQQQQQQQQHHHESHQEHQDQRESHRRGRPRADALTSLMKQGSTSPSSIKCSYCNRVFPREKSLQAHLRTHTGERPYPCDYPGCQKAFTQSGQLKTHQRLHTGEKPFLCTAPGCEMRFTHANRHCPDHPFATLTRSDDFVLKPVSGNTELPHDVTRWLERYKMAREREDKTPTGKSDRKKKQWKSNSETHKRIKSRKGLIMDTVVEQENLDRAPQSQSRLYCSESQDSQDESQDEDPSDACAMLQTSEDEEAVGIKLPVTPLRRPLDRLQPKKRWLREACLEQQLAKPLRWDVHPTNNCHRISELHTSSQWCLSESQLPSLRTSINSQEDEYVPLNPEHTEQYVDSPLLSAKLDNEEKETNRTLHIENEMRPTVLMLAGRNQTTPKSCPSEIGNTDVKVIVVKQEDSPLSLPFPEDNQKWLGALALMELAKTQEEAARALRLSRDFMVHATPNYTHL